MFVQFQSAASDHCCARVERVDLHWRAKCIATLDEHFRLQVHSLDSTDP